MPNKIDTYDEQLFVDSNKGAVIFHEKDIHKVPWKMRDVDVVIDSSGVHSNVINARKIKDINKCIVTHAPKSHLVDKSIVIGVNEETLTEDDFLISSSICDTCAFAPTVNLLKKEYGIEHGFITTLHPWLNYQNLLDGPSPSFAYPGEIHHHYVLGRASPFSLIPKPTSCVTAAEQVLPWLKGKFMGFSFRVPTMTVSAADISVKLKKKYPLTDSDEIKLLFVDAEKKQKFNVFNNNFEPLVSRDFESRECSAVIDHRWTKLNDSNYLKLILWYDNEYGYSSLVVDLIKYLEENY